MGLLTLTQIPCHHVLATEIALNLKYRIGLKHFFNINLGIGIIKKLLFLFVFSTYLPFFYSNFNRESSLDVELNSASNEYPLCILLMNHATQKTRNTWYHHHVFSGISCFGGIGFHQKYFEWVLVGCRI